MDIDLTVVLGLVPYLVIKKYYVWQFFTYMFLHGSIFHLLFNMLMLWMFGSELCKLWGKRFFIKYYMITGIGGGMCVTALSLVFPSQFATPTIGASGAIFGLFLAYGLIFKDKYLYVFGLIPVKARPLVIVMGSIELLSLFSEKNSSISHLAHLGGLFTGLAYLKIKEYERKILMKRYNGQKNDNIIPTDFGANRDRDKNLWN
ncbi:MAG: rhomboid family intramembrane serine protease [Proteobacteria bacterium]|nr:rhomboid family intramembrane serine protease [Pseudomonadota bacterium]